MLKGAFTPIGGVTAGFLRGWLSPARNPRTSLEDFATPRGFRDTAPSREIATPSGLPCGPPMMRRCIPPIRRWDMGSGVARQC